jgi:hypothetical protein
MKRIVLAAVVMTAICAVLVTVTWVSSSRAINTGTLVSLFDPPKRVLDTRKDSVLVLTTPPTGNVCDPNPVNPPGTQGGKGLVLADSAFCFQITSLGFDAIGVLLNVTATDSEGPGYIQLLTGAAVPGATSHLNKIPGQTVANQVSLPLGPIRGEVYYYVTVVNQGGATNIVIDIEGYYKAPA